MSSSRTLYLTGLPCSGMDLLSQMLSQHPEIHSSNLRSPLCEMLINLRSFLSNNPQMSAHLAANFPQAYDRSLAAYQGLMQGWRTAIDHPWVIDASPNWIQHLELVNLLDPEYRMVVCVRELGQIYGAIEAQHQKTLLFDFSEQPFAKLTRSERAMSLLSSQGAIGAPLKAMEHLQYLEKPLQQELFYVVFEHLINNPTEVIKDLCEWLKIAPFKIDLQKLTEDWYKSQQPAHKYVETFYPLEQPLPYYPLPQQFEVTLPQRFPWFYATFYSGQR